MAGRLGYPALTSAEHRCRATHPVAVSADRGQHLGAQQAQQPQALRALQSRCARLHGLSLGIFGNGVRGGGPMTETIR
jgi:hypothetical protein